MAELVPVPVLDSRDEVLLAAEAIARASGGLTAERIERNIAVQRELLALAEAGALSAPICSELTNANPSSAHVVLLEAFLWVCALMMYKINQVPTQNLIAFARLFRVELRDATAATTMLHFTVAPPPGTGATIPAGTEVATAEGDIVFQTDAELVIPAGATSGEVSATRTTTGATMLSTDTLTDLLDSVAWVTAVTNPEAVESGSDKESATSALERARNYQRRAERLVSGRDLEDAILEEVLGGNGIVRAFPLVKDGDFGESRAGHTTVVVMTRTGDAVSSEVRRKIGALLSQAVGSQFIYLRDPSFVTFNVSANVKLDGLATQSVTLAAIENNLRKFYSVSAGNFGRAIHPSEIIAEIEKTDGVDRIEAWSAESILITPANVVAVAPYELPRLETVTLNVV
ncbi:MAG: baseplate J/gp47 family protein [Pyrinomonadaceae bacterium]